LNALLGTAFETTNASMGHGSGGNVAGIAELRRPVVSSSEPVEIIDATELGARLKLPKSWILENTRSRAVDPIPHLKFGKYTRFRWNSPELRSWLERRAAGKGGL
jgi:hypothetical protein